MYNFVLCHVYTKTNKQKKYSTCILSIYCVVKRSSTLSSSGPPQTSFISCTSFNIFSPLSILVWFIGLIWDAKQLPVSASSGDPSQRCLGSNRKIWSFDMEIDCTIFSVLFFFFIYSWKWKQPPSRFLCLDLSFLDLFSLREWSCPAFSVSGRRGIGMCVEHIFGESLVSYIICNWWGTLMSWCPWRDCFFCWRLLYTVPNGVMWWWFIQPTSVLCDRATSCQKCISGSQTVSANQIQTNEN